MAYKQFLAKQSLYSNPTDQFNQITLLVKMDSNLSKCVYKTAFLVLKKIFSILRFINLNPDINHPQNLTRKDFSKIARRLFIFQKRFLG